MKYIYRLSIFVAALVLASACIRVMVGTEPQPPRDVTVKAGVDTKTLLSESSVMWENGDEIAVLFTHAQTQASHVTSMSTSFEEGTLVSEADFTGTLASEVSVAGGYNPTGFAVYPKEAVAEDGTVAYTLPSVQTVHESGSFASDLNLSSAVISLADIDETGSTKTTFRNALSVLRFKLSSDVASVTLTGTAPFAGKAPLEWYPGEDDAHAGRLLVDADAEWADADKQMSVTLFPAAGAETFTDDFVCNLLVWPGTHTSLTVSIDFKDLGEYSRTVDADITFEPSKYYTINFNVDAQALVTSMENRIGSVEDDIDAIKDRITAAEGDLSAILSQIQSVALMGDYADNSVIAPYADFSSSKMKIDIELDYIVRPASVAAELVGKYADALSATVCYRTSSGQEFVSLPVTEVSLEDDVMSVKVGAESLADAFYAGTQDAELALQISDGKTDILSDFAYLIPAMKSAIKVNYRENVPVIQGARVTIPFSFALSSDASYSIAASGNEYVGNVSVTGLNADYKTGYLSVNISDDYPVESQTAALTLTVGDEVFAYDFTFVEGGQFVVTSNGAVDHIGGEVTVSVSENSFGNYAYALTTGGDWIQQVGSSSSGITYSVGANTGSQRAANIDFTVTNGGLNYIKSFPVIQYASGTSLTRTYYSDGSRVLLSGATASGITKPLNIVILGDGYQKKDLAEGGKFERSARSAMNSFFGVEPFASFIDRFNVYMLAYESTDEGTDITSDGVSKSTKFHSVWAGGNNTQLTCDWAAVKTAVEAMGLTASSYDLYRTVAILLVNTDANAGSTNYLDKAEVDTSYIGDGYQEFSIAAVAANNTSVGGLVRHEAGGHGFGRLADEYNTGNASRNEATLLNEQNNYGFYQNVSFRNDSSCPWSDLFGYDGTSCFEGAWGSATGIYRPSETSIMLNNQGEFNAPSRRIIYKRIIRQTEGDDAYTDAKFKSYDSKNL